MGCAGDSSCFGEPALFLCLLSALNLRAEDEPLRGRLPDGRAFRTDAQGVQIVDYIAELELSIDALNRRVKGLESELEENREALADRGGAPKPKLVERDLIDARRDCPPCEPQGVNSALADAEREIEMLRADLKAERIRAESDARKADGGRDRCAGRVEELTLAPAQAAFGAPAPSAGGKAQFSPERMRAIAAVRGELRSEMNKLQGLVEQRGIRFKQYQSRPRSVDFKLSPLVSSSSKNLAAIRQEVDAETEIGRLNALRGDVRQMQSRVRDDISLMERLMR